MEKFYVFQGVLTPTLEEIITSVFPSEYDSLKEMALKVNAEILSWVNMWNKENFNIIIVDFFEHTTLLEIVMKLNKKRYKRIKKKENIEE